MVYRNHLVNKSSLDRTRIAFIEELVAVIMKDEPYMYFDEAALHGFM